MTLATQLIEQVYVAGGQIQARDGKLKLSAPEPLPPELMTSLREHKQEIMQALCAHCDNVIGDESPMVIDATGADPHPRFHAHCYEPWLIARRNVARQALSTR